MPETRKAATTKSEPAKTKTAAKAATRSAATPTTQRAAPAARQTAAATSAKPKSQSARRAAPLLSVDPEQRRNYVEVAAYYIAERRGFMNGDETTDWLAAEQEIDRLLQENKLSA